MSVKHVIRPEDVPAGPHWAIFKFFSVSQSLYTPNDSSVDGCSYEAYTVESEWLAEIQHLVRKGHAPYVATKVTPVRVTTKVDVSVDS